MIEKKVISVLLNLNPKYFHKDLIHTYIEDLLDKNVLNNCFQNLGKVLKINKVISIGLGKIHIDTGFSKTPVTFEADVFLPKVDDILVGSIERYDSNGGIYVNYKNILSIFCLNTNINTLLNKKFEKSENDNEMIEDIGKIVSVKITKININEQNLIAIGKLV